MHLYDVCILHSWCTANEADEKKNRGHFFSSTSFFRSLLADLDLELRRYNAYAYGMYDVLYILSKQFYARYNMITVYRLNSPHSLYMRGTEYGGYDLTHMCTTIESPTSIFFLIFFFVSVFAICLLVEFSFLLCVLPIFLKNIFSLEKMNCGIHTRNLD